MGLDIYLMSRPDKPDQPTGFEFRHSDGECGYWRKRHDILDEIRHIPFRHGEETDNTSFLVTREDLEALKLTVEAGIAWEEFSEHDLEMVEKAISALDRGEFVYFDVSY